MKTLRRITILMLAFILAGTTLLSGQLGRGRNTSPGQFCANLPDITDKQKKELATLSGKHQSEMDALRNELWSSSDISKRNELATRMQSLRNSHITEIRNLLTDKQRELFDSYCPAYGGRGQAMGNRYGRGRGAGAFNGQNPATGYGRGTGRGWR